MNLLNGRLCPFSARRRGLTLVELAVAIAIVSVILVAIGSAMLIAGQALPERNGPAAAAVAAAAVTDQLVGELQYAVSIISRSANAVEFTVADRNGDEIPELIRYAWSGKPGDPLTRRYNGGREVEMLSDVREFSLSYDLKIVREEEIGENESAETILIRHTSNQHLGDRHVTNSEWYGQYFRPLLPPEAISWRVTRVEFYAKSAGAASGEARVQLQLSTSGNYPSGVVLEEKPLMESTLLETYTKQQFAFSSVSGLSPGDGLCLVVKHVGGKEACKLWTATKYAGGPTTYLLKTRNGGAVWEARTGESMLFAIYGTFTSAGTPVVRKTCRLVGVRIKLAIGEHTGSGVLTGVKVLNAPEVIEQ